jgi:hypothetical protein
MRVYDLLNGGYAHALKLFKLAAGQRYFILQFVLRDGRL